MALTAVLMLFLGLRGAQQSAEAELEGARRLASRELGLAAELSPQLYRLDLEAARAQALSLAEDPALLAQLARRLKTPADYHDRHDLVDARLKELRDASPERVESPTLKAPLGAWSFGAPYLIFAVDEAGLCVAHTNNPRCFTEDETGTEYTRMAELFPQLGALLKTPESESFVDIWVVDHKPLLVAGSVARGARAARRRATAELPLGAVVVAYPLSKLASHYQERLKLGFAFSHNGSIEGGSSLDSDLEQALQSALSAGQGAAPEGVMLSSGRLGALPGGELGFVVTLSWEERLRALESDQSSLILSVIAALLSLLLLNFAHARWVEPFKEIDLGLIEIQNGNQDYWFSYNIKDNGISRTIAQNLDVVVSRYLGRPEPELEDEEDA